MAVFYEACSSDDELRQCIEPNRWDNPLVSPVKEELSQPTSGSAVLRGSHFIVPRQLRGEVLKLAHVGHQGIVKTKIRLRSNVWWPRIDADAGQFCRKCHSCPIVGQLYPPEPMARSLPTGPWQDDLLGPMPQGEMLLVVDYFSRYVEVAITRSPTSDRIVSLMKKMFALFGVPVTVIIDNGTCFVSEEFRDFLTIYGIKHLTFPPLWLQVNGEVEQIAVKSYADSQCRRTRL